MTDNEEIIKSIDMLTSTTTARQTIWDELKKAKSINKQILSFAMLHSLNSSTDNSGLPPPVLKQMKEKYFTPLLLAHFLSLGNTEGINSLLAAFDVLSILLKNWLLPVHEALPSNLIKIIDEDTTKLLKEFIKSHKKSITQELYCSRIFPILQITLDKDPQNFLLIRDQLGLLEQKLHEYGIKNCISVCAAICNSPYNASLLMEALNSHLGADAPIKQFLLQMNEALTEIVAKEVSEESKSAVKLFARLLEFLPFDITSRLLTVFSEFRGDDCISYFFELLFHRDLRASAMKCLAYSVFHKPEQIATLLESDELKRTIETDSQAIPELMNCISSLLTVYFSRFSPGPMPLCISYFCYDLFTETLFMEFPNAETRISSLISILQTTYDYILCSPAFIPTLLSNHSFTKALLKTIKVIHSSLDSLKKSVLNEEITSESHKFLDIALKLIERLLQADLSTSELSYFSKTFFNGKSDTSAIFSILIQFLRYPEECSMLRDKSLDVIELLCAVAQRLNDSVDAFYPRTGHLILNELMKANLFNAKTSRQTSRILDFITNTLKTQTSFAYSFVRQIASSFCIKAYPLLTKLSTDHRELVYSISRLLSQLFITLSNTSAFTSDPSFYNSLLELIKMPSNECEIIASKAYLIHCFIATGERIPSETISSLIAQIKGIFQIDPVHLKTSIKFDIRKFQTTKREYGTNFLVDLPLLRRYLVDQQPSIEDFAITLNSKLSKIDAATKLLNSLYCVLLKKFEGTNAQSIVEILDSMIANFIFPDSTVKVAIDLLELCLGVGSEVSFKLDSDFLKKLAKMLATRDFNQLQIEKILGFATIERGDAPAMIPIFDELLKTASFSAAAEAAVHLIHEPNWINEEARIEQLKSACINFVISKPDPKKSSSDYLKMMTIIISTEGNAKTLFQNDFFQLFDTSLHFYNDSASDVWPALFEFFAAVPPDLRVSFNFLMMNFQFVSEILNHTDYKDKVSLQKSVTAVRLVEAVAGQLEKDLSSVFLQEVMGEQVRKANRFMRETSELTFFGSLGDVGTFSQSLAALAIMNACLTFFNEIYEFPKGDFKMSRHKDYREVTKMARIITRLGKCLEESQTRMVIQTIEKAMRIFVGRSLMLFTKQTMDEDLNQAKVRVREELPRVRQAIEQTIKKAKELEMSESVDYLQSLQDEVKAISQIKI